MPTIIHTPLSAEYFFKEGCHILELSNSAADEAVSIARARVEPGQTTRWHRLCGTTERYVILQGTGSVDVGELPPQQVAAGDVVVIPPLCRQRITNSGDTELIFLAICSPRFKPENYEEIA
jgi:mannose-6-phosphate isomerase-like protein (cupin superfamily)